MSHDFPAGTKTTAIEDIFLSDTLQPNARDDDRMLFEPTHVFFHAAGRPSKAPLHSNHFQIGFAYTDQEGNILAGTRAPDCLSLSGAHVTLFQSYQPVRLPPSMMLAVAAQLPPTMVLPPPHQRLSRVARQDMMSNAFPTETPHRITPTGHDSRPVYPSHRVFHLHGHRLLENQPSHVGEAFSDGHGNVAVCLEPGTTIQLNRESCLFLRPYSLADHLSS
jgi:hypothetical protein